MKKNEATYFYAGNQELWFSEYIYIKLEENLESEGMPLTDTYWYYK